MTSDHAATLEALLRDADERLARLAADERTLLLDRADATADDEHDPEGSTLSGEWQRVDQLRRGIEGERDDIAAALTRVAEGTYGLCTVCGRPIAAGRLEVRPTAATCVACAV
ncbi:MULTISPECIES: TraR/DksA family transcriptional regulator [unclassified Microbacterium]|uniref:TraR/DksA family transcriptional regulator n=1 Tax=unclassified Microbacterium TaxID=2609290 RepID=UPI003746E8BA